MEQGFAVNITTKERVMRAVIRKEVCRKVGLLQRQIDALLKA
jgi:hypothetical protein